MKFLVSITLALVFGFCACGREHTDNRSKRRTADQNPAANLLESGDQVLVEQLIVDRINQDLADHSYDKTSDWSNHLDNVTVHEKLEAKAKAKISSVAISSVKKLSDEKFNLEFAAKGAIKNIDLKYFADDKKLATLANVEIPVSISATIYVAWKVKNDQSIQFTPNKDDRFVSNLVLAVTGFEYQDEFTKNMEPEVKDRLKAKVEKLLNHVLKDKEGSVESRINADLNKLQSKDKSVMTRFVTKAADKVESIQR
jgi:hypothetical protein